MVICTIVSSYRESLISLNIQGNKQMKLYEHWGIYEGEADEFGKACGVGKWTRHDNLIWIGTYKDDGGHGRLTFYR